MGELASEANKSSTIQNSFFGLFGHALDHFCMSWKPGQFDAYPDGSTRVQGWQRKGASMQGLGRGEQRWRVSVHSLDRSRRGSVRPLCDRQRRRAAARHIHAAGPRPICGPSLQGIARRDRADPPGHR